MKELVSLWQNISQIRNTPTTEEKLMLHKVIETGNTANIASSLMKIKGFKEACIEEISQELDKGARSLNRRKIFMLVSS